MAGLFFTDFPPSWEKIRPVKDPGLCDPPGKAGSTVRYGSNYGTVRITKKISYRTVLPALPPGETGWLSW